MIRFKKKDKLKGGSSCNGFTIAHYPPSRRVRRLSGCELKTLASAAGGEELSRVTGKKTGTEEAQEKGREDQAKTTPNSMHQDGRKRGIGEKGCKGTCRREEGREGLHDNRRN
jgi:hypothetical protein